VHFPIAISDISITNNPVSTQSIDISFGIEQVEKLTGVWTSFTDILASSYDIHDLIIHPNYRWLNTGVPIYLTNATTSQLFRDVQQYLNDGNNPRVVLPVIIDITLPSPTPIRKFIGFHIESASYIERYVRGHYNYIPEISGNPTTSILAGDTYSFIPSAVDPDNDPIHFTITNRPAWATFNDSTGALTGTAVAGSYDNIKISVTDGGFTSSLPAFSITVPGPPINGACGAAHGTTVNSVPSTDLCSAGLPSRICGSGPWTWSCEGLNGGSNALCSADIRDWNLNVNIAGTGSGNVNSVPSGIHCATGSTDGCSVSFASGTTINLYATPSINSSFTGWEEVCGGVNNCIVDLANDMTVTAIFDTNYRVKLLETSATYGSLQDAYNAASDNEYLLAQDYNFVENLNFGKPVHVILKGGMDSTYSEQFGITAIMGRLTISSGSVKISKVIIR